MKRVVLVSTLILLALFSFSQHLKDSSKKDGDSIMMEALKSATKVADGENMPYSPEGQSTFNPQAKEYEYIKDPTPFTSRTSDLEYFNALNQPISHKIGRYFLNNSILISCYFLVCIIGLFIYFKQKSQQKKEYDKRRALKHSIKQSIWLFLIGGILIFALTGAFSSDANLKLKYIENTDTPIWGTGSAIRWKTLFPCSFLLVSLSISLVATFLNYRRLAKKIN